VNDYVLELVMTITAHINLVACRSVAISLAFGVLLITSGCVYRDVTLYGGGFNQPIEGHAEGTLGSGTATMQVTMPSGEILSGRATFYWGSGYRQEIDLAFNKKEGTAIGVSQGGQRMCHATMMGTSGLIIDCYADVDPLTAHGAGECIDSNKQKYMIHF
jgi:hypothetical protein